MWARAVRPEAGPLPPVCWRAVRRSRPFGSRNSQPSTDGWMIPRGALRRASDSSCRLRPLDGVPATEQTEVYIAYDSQRLYFGIYAHYSNPSLVRANRVDRDRTENDDTVTVFFDPFLDQQSGYSLSVNGYGVQGDALVRGTGGSGGQGVQRVQGDTSWNALFQSAGQLVEDGWTAEMVIPFKSLRYPARGGGEAHRWGFQVQREIQSKNETVVWAPISRDISGFLRQMGLLEGISNLSTSRNLELLPSVTAIQAGRLDSKTGTFNLADSAEAGIYLKYGVTSNLTLDFAYNPDFSQIESDRQQIEVNQRFPVNYPEQRPFFVEGPDNFRLGGPVGQMVHTRTIVDPHYGAKLTGKVGRVTMGFMVARDQAPGRVDDRSDPAFGRTAQVVAGRAQYELFPENTLAGMFTSREFMNGYSRAYGYDLQLRMGSIHTGQVKGAFTDHVDEHGVRRIGHWNELNLRRRGRNFSYTLHHDEIEPDVKTDLGFIRRVDVRNTRGTVSYSWWPEHAIVSWGPEYSFDWNYDFRGNLQEQNNSVGLSFTFAKNIDVGGNVSRNLERFRDVDFRKTRVSLNGGVRTSRRISFSGSINHGDEIRYVDTPYLGSGTGWEASVTLRPISRLQSLITADTNRFTDLRSGTEVFDIQDSARDDDLSVYGPPARAKHPRERFIRQEIWRQPARHVSCERRDGVFHRLRRPLPPGGPNRLERVSRNAVRAHQPRHLQQAAGLVQVLNKARFFCSCCGKSLVRAGGRGSERRRYVPCVRSLFIESSFQYPPRGVVIAALQRGQHDRTAEHRDRQARLRGVRAGRHQWPPGALWGKC